MVQRGVEIGDRRETMRRTGGKIRLDSVVVRSDSTQALSTTYVGETGFLRMQNEVKMKMVLQALCTSVFKGMHLLGVAVREVLSQGSVAPLSSISQAVYLLCALAATIELFS